MFQAADGIGTIHYSRFTVLSENTLLFLGEFDGEFGQLMSDLARHAGPVFGVPDDYRSLDQWQQWGPGEAARAHGMMMPAPVIMRPSRSW